MRGSSTTASGTGSLSAIAKKVTGSHINGYRFFGLQREGDDQARPNQPSWRHRTEPWRAKATHPLRAIYTRKSSEEGLEQEFNSLDAQREAAEAYIASQKAEGWTCLPDRYDDGGFTGGNMERPALEAPTRRY